MKLLTALSFSFLILSSQRVFVLGGESPPHSEPITEIRLSIVEGSIRINVSRLASYQNVQNVPDLFESINGAKSKGALVVKYTKDVGIENIGELLKSISGFTFNDIRIIHPVEFIKQAEANAKSFEDAKVVSHCPGDQMYLPYKEKYGKQCLLVYPKLLASCQMLCQSGMKKSSSILLKFYWDLGYLINSTLGCGRSEYGKATILDLSTDLKISKTNLYLAMGLASKFERSALSPKLTWSHYKEIVTLDTALAHDLAKRAVEEDLSVAEVRDVCRSLRKSLKRKRSKKKASDVKRLLQPIKDLPDVNTISRSEVEELVKLGYTRIVADLSAAERKISKLKARLVKAHRDKTRKLTKTPQKVN